MNDWEDWAKLALVLYFVGRWLYRLTRARASESLPSAPAPDYEPEDEQDDPEPERAAAGRPDAYDPEEDGLLAELAGRALAAERRARSMLQAYRADLAFAPFAAALSDHVVPELQELLRALDEARTSLRRSRGAIALDESSLREAEHVLRTARVRLDHLAGWWAQRGSPRDRAVLGDADALARALVEPVFASAEQRGVDVRRSVPVCAFWDRGPAMSLLFEGTGVAPVLLPRRFGLEVTSWPVIAHEVGHAIHAAFPGLAEEVEGLLSPVLPVDAWAAELFADGVGTLLLGPAFAWAHENELASPKDPLRVVIAPATASGEVSEHPPAHLRLRLVVSVLESMGFPAEAAEVWSRWTETHGHPTALYFPHRHGGLVGVDAASILAGMEEAAARLTGRPLTALGGSTLAGFPGLAFGPSEQQEAASRALDLGRGLARPGDPRVVIAAAILAAGSIRATRLSELVRRAILGVGEGREPSSREAARARQAAAPDWRSELVEALVLTESVLTPARAARWGPR